MEQLEQPVTATETAPTYEPPAHDASASHIDAPPKDTTEKAEATETVKDSAAKSAAKGEATPSKKPVPDSLKGEKKSDWIQSRISHYASETRAAREEAKQIREELAQLKAQQTGGKPPTKAGQPPNPDDYTQYSDYVDALVDWKVEQREAQSKLQSQRDSQSTDYAVRRSAFDQELVRFAQEYENPQAVMLAMQSDDLPITQAMGDAIMDLGQTGVETLFHLSQNPEEAYRIAAMHPRMATLAIGQLAAKLQSSVQPASQAVTSQAVQPSAPEPKVIPQVRGSAPSSLDSEPNDKDDVLTWARKEAERMRRNNPGLKVYMPRG